MRVAVVGHLEWSSFALVERVPLAGEIAHAERSWHGVGGGGAVSAVQLARLGGSPTFFTAVGDDAQGRAARAELEGLGVRVVAAPRADESTRRAQTLLDAAGERTITVLGEGVLRPRGRDLLPWRELSGADAVLFMSGDAEALRRARAARVLVAAARDLATLRAARVPLDALVGSGADAHERHEPGELEPPPAAVVETTGASGGAWHRSDGRHGSYPAAPLLAEPVDAYGCGDSFAAGFTFGLGSGLSLTGALELAARCGAAALTGRAPFGGQLEQGGARGAVDSLT